MILSGELMTYDSKASTHINVDAFDSINDISYYLNTMNQTLTDFQ